MATQPGDCRDAIHWFVNNFALNSGSVRGLFLQDFSDDGEAVLEGAVLNLRGRGINPLLITGESLYQQAHYLWQQAVQGTQFGRPVASKLELDIYGADLIVLKDLEAPESAPSLWYLFHHVLYPRALSGKTTIITTPLGYEEFVLYGAGSNDFEYAGRKLTWEKLVWVLNATMINLHQFKTLKDAGLPPMLKSEYELFAVLKERNLPVKLQHVLDNYMLDFALIEKDRKLDIECETMTTLDGPNAHAGEAKRSLLLLSDGWKILKFTTAEILSNRSACADAVEEVWQHGRKKVPFGRLLSGQATAAIPKLPQDDDVQRLAIKAGGGPVAIVGGAGTGKSSCVINRVAYLLGQGVNPDKVLVLSLNQEAVGELKSAVEQLVDRQMAQRAHFYSWHNLGLKILKENLSAIKRKPPLKVELNPLKIVQRLVNKHKKELDPATLELSQELDEFTLLSLISLYKANLVSPKYVKERGKTEIDELVAKVYHGYEEHLQKINRIDRDDMVSLAAQVLLDHPEIRRRYQYAFDYVIVDEFQDATAACDVLARILAFPQDNLYIAGDEDVTIYESKGAVPKLLGDISIKLPNARCYVLEKNWRSHPAIVDHSRQLVAGLTRRRIQKDTVSGWGAAPTAAIIGPHMLPDELSEAEWVADEIQILLDSGRSPSDIAVLYRYHRYALIVEEALSKRRIRCRAPHPEAGLVPDEVGDMMSFLRLVMDPDGPKARESFERICQLRVSNIDPKLSQTISGFAEANNLSYLKAIEIYSEAVADQSCKELVQLVRTIRTMHQENLPPAETIALLTRTLRLKEYYGSIKITPTTNYQPLQKLVQLEEQAHKFKTISELVNAFASAKSSAAADKEEGSVHVLSAHEAKGREFLVVFIVGLAEGLFPAEITTDIEEEKRLCYVAMTRARELLYMSLPAAFNNVPLEPSSFLKEAGLTVQSSPALIAQGNETKAMPSDTVSTETAASLAPTAISVAQTPTRPLISRASHQLPPQSLEAVAVKQLDEQLAREEVSEGLVLSGSVAASSTHDYSERSSGIQENSSCSVQESFAQLHVSHENIIGQVANALQLEMATQVSSAHELGVVEQTHPLMKQALSGSSTTSVESGRSFSERTPKDSAADNGVDENVLPEPALAQFPPERILSKVNSYPGTQYAQPDIQKTASHEDIKPHFTDGATLPRCRGCDSILEVGSRFCGECGYELPVRTPACHRCNAPLDPEAKFCGECGSKRVTKEPATVTQSRQAPNGEDTSSPGRSSQRGFLVNMLKKLEQ